MSRVPIYKSPNYCFFPRAIWRDGEQVLVPCGKCDGCLLHKSNKWSARLSADVNTNKYTLFFTLTYNNKYLPKLLPCVGEYGLVTHVSNHKDNIYFNGVFDVCREDDIVLPDNLSNVKIQNCDFVGIPYVSKRDIQLYLKRLRKLLYEKFSYRPVFRYFIIAEYGPTTFRPHYHGLAFFGEQKVAEYAKDYALFAAWQMCDKVRFDEYTTYAGSNAAGYVTQYITSIPDLPTCYGKSSPITPFRLSSKSPSIGYSSFDKASVAKQVGAGVIDYVREVSKIECEPISTYSADYIHTIYPKVFGYSKFSFNGLLRIYGSLFTLVRKFGYTYDAACGFLREFCKPQTWYGMRKCYSFCVENKVDPFVYVSFCDTYYYKSAMRSLREMYQRQIDNGWTIDTATEYVNISNLALSYVSNGCPLYVDMFFTSLGIYLSSSDVNYNHNIARSMVYKTDKNYMDNVTTIVKNSAKMPKYYEMVGLSPHIY